MCHQPIGPDSDFSEDEYDQPEIIDDDDDEDEFDDLSMSELSNNLSSTCSGASCSELSYLSEAKQMSDKITLSSKDCVIEESTIRMDELRIKEIVTFYLREFYESIDDREIFKQDFDSINIFEKIFKESEIELRKSVYDSYDIVNFVIENFLDKIELEDYYDESFLQEDFFLDILAERNSELNVLGHYYK